MSETVPEVVPSIGDSILASTKKNLGLSDDYDAFDLDVIMHINSVFTVLSQLGIGPANGFRIEDRSTTWDDFIGDDVNRDSVKTYMFLRVKLYFDPPGTSFHIAAIEKQIEELGWRLNVQREGESWAEPVRPSLPEPWEPVW
jgi:hypothetical protein